MNEVNVCSQCGTGQSSYHFQLLAPPHTEPSVGFPAVVTRHDIYHSYLSSMQRLRGSAYLADHAITPWQVDDDGRFKMHDDENCWHFLLVDPFQEVIACARYLVHPPMVRFEDLRLALSTIARDSTWGAKVRFAVESELEFARRRGEAYVEVGGWAIAPEYRNTRAALDTLLGSYAWGQIIGGCICSCTATQRNNSAPILRRIGGTPLHVAGEEIPPYYDPHYGCTMELLRFDSRIVDPKFSKAVASVKQRLSDSVAIKPSIASQEVLEEVAFQKSLMALGGVLSWNTNTFAALQQMETNKEFVHKN